MPPKELSWSSRLRTCAVAACKTPHPRDASLHAFPKEPSLRRVWVDACRRKGH